METHEYPFYRGVSGLIQSTGDSACRQQFDQIPRTTEILQNVKVTGINQVNGQVSVTGEVSAGAKFNGIGVDSSLSASQGSGTQTSNQVEQNYQFRLSYAVDLLGKPLTHVNHVWYHRDLGICVANQDVVY